MITINEYCLTHINVKDTIVFVIIQMKHYYDLKYTLRFFEPEDIMNLCLHHRYFLSSLLEQNKKLSQQFVKSIHILERIEQLTYRLDILSL